MPVYAYDPKTNELKGYYSSLRSCVQALNGDRNINTTVLKNRLKYGELYMGLKVVHSPINLDD